MSKFYHMEEVKNSKKLTSYSIRCFTLLSCKIDDSIRAGLPVTIRLLDPPLHEFLPEGNLEEIVGQLTTDTGMSEDEVYSRIEKLSEVNPMLGFRGCRCSSKN